MKKRRNTNPQVPGPPASVHLPIAGLAVCFIAALFFSQSFAQRAVTYPARGVPGPVAPAGQQDVQITGVMVSYLPNRPEVRLSDVGSSTPRRGSWMRILIQFTSRPDWMNDVRFDCYVLLRDGGDEHLLTGSATCTQVPEGRGHAVCLYVPPNTVERYGGRARAVAVECYYQNTVVTDYSAPRMNRKWWQDYTGIPDAMVTWFYTPFSREGIGMFEQVKPVSRGF